jgi:hypothetical protein
MTIVPVVKPTPMTNGEKIAISPSERAIGFQWLSIARFYPALDAQPSIERYGVRPL